MRDRADASEIIWRALSAYEKEKQYDIDKTAGFFGAIMAELFVYAEDEWTEKLRRMGFYFGKFIYLMDAYEDIEEDLKQGRYNLLQNYIRKKLLNRTASRF